MYRGQEEIACVQDDKDRNRLQVGVLHIGRNRNDRRLGLEEGHGENYDFKDSTSSEKDLRRLLFPKWLLTTLRRQCSGLRSALIKSSIAFSHRKPGSNFSDITFEIGRRACNKVRGRWDVDGWSWPSAGLFFAILSAAF